MISRSKLSHNYSKRLIQFAADKVLNGNGKCLYNCNSNKSMSRHVIEGLKLLKKNTKDCHQSSNLFMILDQ